MAWYTFVAFAVVFAVLAAILIAIWLYKLRVDHFAGGRSKLVARSGDLFNPRAGRWGQRVSGPVLWARLCMRPMSLVCWLLYAALTIGGIGIVLAFMHRRESSAPNHSFGTLRSLNAPAGGSTQRSRARTQLTEWDH
jgi:hypothetical protein